ncbi:hypothetical protein [Thermofilum pendens]|uniref:Uncharacterized protein n=1 Tax=Thermofilum pendens (strain DSM 2475 / Hrk 5) TaxID=368408 RepID=A1S0P4_THEPD|nr:hypothetical protein [Thermofilum pendens]ABL79024.1 hypothetical protein Tpen_1629 [Thermofilum pendens Hrk 5]
MRVVSGLAAFIVVVLALAASVASTFILPPAFAPAVFWFVVGGWLVLAALLAGVEESRVVPARALYALYGGLAVTASAAYTVHLLVADARVSLLVLLAGVGATGVAFYVARAHR